MCCYTAIETLKSAKQAMNDKLQGSVATYSSCGGVVNNQKFERFIAECVSENFFYHRWIFGKSYKQECVCLMHFARLANTLLKDDESSRDNHVFACNFATYSPILIFFHSQIQQ